MSNIPSNLLIIGPSSDGTHYNYVDYGLGGTDNIPDGDKGDAAPEFSAPPTITPIPASDEAKDENLQPDWETVLRCPDCEEVFDEDGCDDSEPLYECSCGEAFTTSGSADGCSHRSPCCNRFSSKIADKACPNCVVELEDVQAYKNEDGEWIVDD